MIGQSISHYRVLSKLGEGGMGVVYKAEDIKLGRTVALKFVAPHLISDEHAKKRFVREAMAAASLDHPNIATVFEIDEIEDRVFLAMSLVEGRALSDAIADRPLELADLLDIALQTATALRAAHEQGVVHRDIKPYVESTGGQLWVRDIDQERARPVPGATRVAQAFWSPDSRFIAYAEGPELKRIPAQGGTPATITTLTGNFNGGAWSQDGQTILYADGAGLHTVPAAGGSPTRILEHRHLEQPSFLELPDGRQAFLFQVQDGRPYHAVQYLIAGDETRHTIVTPTSSNPYPAFSPTGHILYVDGAGASIALWALPFSLSGLSVTGKPFPVAQGGSSPRLSRTGTLVYSDAPLDVFQLAWCDRSGNVLSTVGSPQLYTDPALSPDDRRLAVNVTESGRDIWIYELDRATMTKFTFEAKLPRTPAWSPSGEEIVYSNMIGQSFDLYAKRSNGSADARLIVSTPAQEFAASWSPDGRFLVYATEGDLLYREARRDGELGEPMVFLQTRFVENSPTFSADGKYLAYASTESGRREVYVRPFPPGESKWRVSMNGGTAPRWRRDGKELFYVEGAQLMSATVTAQPALSLGTPSRLFGRRPRQLADLNNNPQYDVSADGQRFIVRERLADEKPLAVHVVHNWFEEFRGQR